MEYYHPDELGPNRDQFNLESKRILEEGLKAASEYEEKERKRPQRFYYEFPSTEQRDDAEKKIVEDTEFNEYFRYLDGSNLVKIGDKGLEINFAQTVPENEKNLEKFFSYHYGYGAVRQDLPAKKGNVVEMPKKIRTPKPTQGEQREAA